MTAPLRLGVNIDHVATLRNARRGRHPDPLRAAQVAIAAGADGITAHLREDRRHILDADIEHLRHTLNVPLNLEMAPTDAMVAIALHHRPHAVCLVPEKRSEITTEGGLDVLACGAPLQSMIEKLKTAGIRVSLFIEPDPRHLDAAHHLGAPVVELHTGAYCDAPPGPERTHQLERLQRAARHAVTLGLECHAGHGLSFETVSPIAAIPTVVELNIGHFLVGEAVLAGLAPVIRQMRALMDAARAPPTEAATAKAAATAIRVSPP